MKAYGPWQQKKICVENPDPKVECPNDRSTLLICYDIKTHGEYLTGISMRGPNYCGRPGAPALFEYLKYRAFLECFESDTEYPGNDINSIAYPITPQECQRLCQMDPRCQFFTAASTNHICWLKTAKSTPKFIKGFITGPKHCSKGN